MSRRPVALRHRSEQRSNDDLAGRTPAELIGMVERLTRDAWAFAEAANQDDADGSHAEPRMKRHLVRIRYHW